MMVLECFLSVIGTANNMNVLIFLSLDQQIAVIVVHSIPWQWKSSCKNFNLFCSKHIINTWSSYLIKCKILDVKDWYYFNPLLYHLSKSSSGWTDGIKNVYHDPCQDWLDLVNMKLTSPNYPEAYDPLEDCTWTITAPQGHYVTLDFIIIDVSKNEISNLFYMKRFWIVPFLNIYISNSFILIMMVITSP